MLSIHRTSLLSAGILHGMTDFHSHILPGVDDGAKNMEEACRMLACCETLGLKQIILTPHISENYPENTKEYLSLRLQQLRSAYHGSLKLTLGAEYMMDACLEAHLQSGPLTIAPHHVLIETPSLFAPVCYRQRMKEIQAKGYHIVLAHPERYAYMDMADYEQLKQERIHFQLNIFSLASCYGPAVKNKARKLLARGFYNCLGTDLHHLADASSMMEDRLFAQTDINKLKKLI